jgi:hypothetical protein
MNRENGQNISLNECRKDDQGTKKSRESCTVIKQKGE